MKHLSICSLYAIITKMLKIKKIQKNKMYALALKTLCFHSKHFKIFENFLGRRHLNTWIINNHSRHSMKNKKCSLYLFGNNFIIHKENLKWLFLGWGKNIFRNVSHSKSLGLLNFLNDLMWFFYAFLHKVFGLIDSAQHKHQHQ